ncbi:DMT family transporter [Pendulispora albinea]|uniref:SMR family transporter n=1 Tax=Pendulispora albinea TaxID=2741071 RepID=A0ABZ2LRF3_9BACT
MGYVFLIGAILFEVIATSHLKLVKGERAVPWAVPVIVGGYGSAFALLTLALNRGIPLGVAYAVWSGFGVVFVAVVSWLAFGEKLGAMQIGGAVMVVSGVVLLELGAHHE